MMQHQPWSTEELEQAVQLRGEGESNARIAWTIGRSERAVSVKLSRQRHPRRARGRMWARISTEHIVAELELRGYTCTPPEHPDARVDL